MKMAVSLKEMHCAKIMIWSHFLFEKRSLVDFQIRSEPYIAHGLGRGKKEREIGGEG